MIEVEFVKVAVEAPIPQLLTYRLPASLAKTAMWGARVAVPLGKRISRGVLVAPETEGHLGSHVKVKSIEDLIDEPVIGDKTLRWLKWLAQYYLHPPGQVYSLAFAPAAEGRKRKSHKLSPTDILKEGVEFAPAPTPNASQKKAIDEILAAAASGKFEPFLLFGVTGSGKTEVYLQSIDSVLKKNKKALVLVPEISLTPQLIKRFVGRFGENVAVLHSHLTERERADQWWSVVRGQKQILVGARSALFCPLEDIGLIIVDEEHEGSFKQEEQLKYNARDAAIMRAMISECPVVLGSATPSLESWHNVLQKKYRLLTLAERVENRPLPVVKIVDMRLEKLNRDFALPHWMSSELYNAIKSCLEKGEQAALFLNRRGFAQFVLCPGCGFTESCLNCSVTLTVHARATKLICHYCGFEKPFKPRCSSCQQEDLKPLGLGTERVAEELKNFFPQARIARADRDEISTRETLENLLNAINKKEIDLIVGTQMIAKGHDFPNLTLVGVILADMGLHFPDFRSSERTFQLLTQVAGRAGRHEKAGEVIVQTYLPSHPAIAFATRHDFEGFATEELKERKELMYPPFGKLAIIRVQGPDLQRVEKASEVSKLILENIKKKNPRAGEIEILGPCEAALSKLRNKFRYHLLLKTGSATSLNIYLQRYMSDTDWIPAGVKIAVDVDPINFL